MDWQSDYYGEQGCCLTCDEETKEINVLDEGECLCYDCMCRQCFWYEPDYDGDYGWSEKGTCEYPRTKYIPRNEKSIYELETISRETDKAVLGTIKGLNGLHWIPISCICSDKKIKRWWIDKVKLHIK